MTNQQIEERIRKYVPEIKKDFIGIKMWKEEPKDVPKYEGPLFPGICTQIGEVLTTGRNFYTTKEQSFCQAANMSVGAKPPLTEEQWLKAHQGHAQLSRDCKSIEIATKYYQVEEINLCPYPKEKNEAVQVGLFKDIKDPDIVLIFSNPLGGDIINRAYAYSLGEIIKGFGSHGGCRFIFGYTYVVKEPTFTIGDPEWRQFIGMDDNEITLAFPYQSLLRFIDDFPEPAEYYRNYSRMMKFFVRNNPKTYPTPELMSNYRFPIK